MFTTREIDYSKDSEAVVTLLQKTFGEVFTPELFNWKHVENPAGQSYGLVAENEQGQVIGVRLFMWWDLQAGNERYKAIRPVDTATDRAYRGKGIFKTLTLQGLEALEGRYDFIFNTPNKKSLPGYLKMGWKTLPADYPYYLGVRNPLGSWKSLATDFSTDISRYKGLVIYDKTKTPDFLNWRYRSIHYKKAHANIRGVDNLLIYRIAQKVVKGVSLKFLIVVEFVGEQACMRKLIQAVCHKEGVLFYHFADFGNTRPLKNFASVKRGKSVIAYRAAEPEKLLSNNFSTGDLEGII